MYLMTFLNVIIHGCQVGSRVVMALFAIKLGATPFAIGLMIALYSIRRCVWVSMQDASPTVTACAPR